MNLLILHLSDMHFGKKNNYTNDNINAIVGALQQSMNDISHVLIIISGDLAFSGLKAECRQVWFFLHALKAAIVLRYQIRDIQIAMVPGNHDIDYQKGDIGRAGLELLEKNGDYAKAIPSELDKQTEFYFLAKRNNCFSSSALLDQKVITYDGKTLQLNLINTAVFSSLDEDQGFHFLTESVIKKLSAQNNCDYVISVMHHPHHWYSSCCKKELEEALYSRSDLIFVGHEHYESSMKIEHDEASVNIFAAGKLGDRGDWTDSEFHVAVLNLDTRAYNTRKYHWNGAAKIYEEIGQRELTLSRDRYNQLGLIVRPEHLMSLEEDRYLISRSVHDYFVFPLLIEEQIANESGRIPKEIDSMESFINTLGKREKIIISGGSDSGKSVLAAEIYTRLASNKVAVFVKGCDVRTNPERTIREAFEDAYSNDKASYEAFKQTMPEDLAIVIDDVDAIEPTREESFLSYVGEHFGVIVETCQAEIDIDIQSRLKKRATSRDFTFYRIAPFYSNKRKQLVTNIVHAISKSDQEAQDHIILLLCDVLTKQKYLYSWNPEFIVQFVKYYCNNIGEAMQNDGSVFSKVFEANITQLIKPYARKITVDKVMMVLDKIAYGIYVDKIYPISLSDADQIIQEYNQIYGSKIVTFDFLNLLIEAKIMKKTDDKFLFYDRNYLAYFTAREIKRRCLEDGDYTQFNHVMEYSYSGLNADILLFVTYITDNLNIIRMVMGQAVKSVEGWKEFNLRDIDIPFLVNPVDQIVRPFQESDREKAEEERIQQEKAEVQAITIANDASIFSGETDELNFVQKVIRGISLMVILARTLPSFEHMMKKEDKDQCVQMLYTMPLRIFEAWAKVIDEESSALIADIKLFHETEYRKEKPDAAPIEDKDALYILKWEATSLLLDLMYAVMNNATRSNTNDFIDGFDYKSLPTYGIEHLIGLAKRDNVPDFSSEAEKLFAEEKHAMTRNMLQRVARNFMANSKRIKKSETQRLNAKLFNESLQQDKLYIEQQRNKNKQ